jgi:hypothetical protein
VRFVSPRGPHQLHDVGVEFVDMDDEARARIEQLIDDVG